MSTDKMCRAFNITISVKEDIDEQAVSKLKNWAVKKALYSYAVLENETSKRHFHACVFCLDPQNPKSIRDTLWKLIKPFHPTSIGRFAVHIQACPGRKWIDEYLQKESSREIVINSLPADLDDLEEYFPDETTQELLKKKSEKHENNVVDLFYANHEVHYKEFLHEKSWVSSIETALQYFQNRMYVKKDMRVIEDQRRLFQKAICLYRYASEDDSVSAEQRRQYLRETTEYDFNPPNRV